MYHDIIQSLSLDLSQTQFPIKDILCKRLVNLSDESGHMYS